MMTWRVSHEELEELITADVLDGLEEAERTFLMDELQRHGPDCMECRELVVDYSEVAGRLATTADSVAVSNGAEERLLRAARGEETLPTGPRAPRMEKFRFARAPGRAGRWVAATAAAAALLVAAGAVGYFVAPRPTSLQRAFLAFEAQPGARLAGLRAANGQQLAVAFRPGDTRGWIVGADLRQPPGDKVYELWALQPQNAPPQPAGTFVPSDGAVLAQVNLGSSFVGLAVTIEPHGGSKKPTPPIIFQTNV